MRLKEFKMRHLFAALLIISGVLSSVAEVKADASGESLFIPVSRSELISLTSDDIAEVIVADPDVADVFVHGTNHISVIGKALGTTTVRAFDRDSNLLRKYNILVGHDLPAIRKALKTFLPYENIGVEPVNANVALTGEVSDAAAARVAVQIVNEFVNPQDPTEERDPELFAKVNVLNLLKIVSGQQVMLRVRIGEIQRNAIKNLGLDTQLFNNAGSAAFSIATGSGVSRVAGGVLATGTNANFNVFPTDTSITRGSITGSVQSGNFGVAGALNMLERDGLFKVLAEPNIVAISGEKAEFLAGGEFPVPVPQDSDTITIEYKKFGVGVQFTPFVLSQSRIRINVEPEVSEISPTGSVNISGFVIPALSTRRASTTVELAPGESFMIAGLIRDEVSSNIDQLPGLKEVPILGALFRSTQYQREETELVIAVTPYIVDPLKSSDVKLPTDGFRPASIMESFFYGALGTISGDTLRISQTPSLEGPIGFIVD
jgi:pilus assembly protein CpaC